MLLTDDLISEEKAYINRLVKLRNLIPSVYWLKEYIKEDDLCAALQVWDELKPWEQSIIWSPAPTKGGILTIREREIMHSNEWHEAGKIVA
ncbi:MAG: hypothetical protein O7D95_02905 [Betaproteobacteria bacterium]|nr:hypothetical protein [Betaproteobacteria bacterium]